MLFRLEVSAGILVGVRYKYFFYGEKPAQGGVRTKIPTVSRRYGVGLLWKC